MDDLTSRMFMKEIENSNLRDENRFLVNSRTLSKQVTGQVNKVLLLYKRYSFHMYYIISHVLYHYRVIIQFNMNYWIVGNMVKFTKSSTRTDNMLEKSFVLSFYQDILVCP